MDKLIMKMSLASLMEKSLPEIQALVLRHPKAKIKYKDDGSPVTELDLALSAQIEKLMEEHFPGVVFYSEEKFSEWRFPLLALDPLDGTREYIDGRDEWAISIGVFENDSFAGEGWVYNPKTNECFDHPVKKAFRGKTKYRGEVSRSECRKGLFVDKSNSRFEVNEMGSIAYKLGRLAFDHSDFVISLRPKNIWDIAGGTILSQKAGMKFYSQGKEVTKVQQIYYPPLIWCSEEIFKELSELYP